MGASLPKPICCTVLERHGDKHFRVGLAEMNGWRNSMEDAHVVHMVDGEGYFGILDGHGGGECSAWCSQRLQEHLAAHGCPKDDAAAKKLLLDTDHAFLSTGMGSGSTPHANPNPSPHPSPTLALAMARATARARTRTHHQAWAAARPPRCASGASPSHRGASIGCT